MHSDVKTMVTIYLRGAWTEAVCAKIRKLLMSSDAMPFILLKHLKLGRPAFTGKFFCNILSLVICIEHHFHAKDFCGR